MVCEAAKTAYGCESVYANARDCSFGSNPAVINGLAGELILLKYLSIYRGLARFNPRCECGSGASYFV